MTFFTRYTLIILALCLLIHHKAFTAIRQDQPDNHVTSLKIALGEISNTFHINFLYESNLLTDQRIDLDLQTLRNAKVGTILTALLHPLSLDFYRVDDLNYALFKKVAVQPKAEFAKAITFSRTDSIKTMNVSGKIQDGQGRSLDYSTVTLFRAKDSAVVKTTLSDSTGHYLFKTIPAGRYLIRASPVGYITGYSPVFDVTADAGVTLPTIVLIASPNQLSEVKVVAKKPLFERRLDRTIVNVESSALAAGGNVNDILDIAPGVTVDNNQISLKGKQGVTVMIDDKIVKLSSSQVTSLLQSMPASSIDKIEIISNPSAKYDAQGKGGIINIKTKKGANLGLNGSITSGLIVGRYARFSEGLNLNYKLKKLNIFSNYSYQHNKSISQYLSDKLISDQNPPLSYHQDETSHSTNSAHNARLGADYDINDKNTVGVLATLNTNEGRSDFVQDVLFNNYLSQKRDSSLSSSNEGRSHFKTYGLNINSRHQLSAAGQLLQLNADYTSYRSKVPNSYLNQFYNESGNSSREPQAVINNSNEKIDLWTAKADYTLPLEKAGKIEAGVKTAYTHSNSDILFQSRLAGAFITDPLRTNTFDYRENINAGYVNYITKFGKQVDFQAGLRAEHTHYSGESMTTGQTVSRNYLQLFPSLFILRNMGDNSLSFSYSRRIGRPDYEDLNPFIDYSSPYFYTQGNPLLKPETTHSFEVNYTYHENLNVSLGYSRTNDYYNYFTSLADSSGTTRQTVDNFKNFDTWNLTISYNKELVKWWTLTANGDLSYDRFQTPYLGSFINVKRAAFNLNILNNFQLSKALSLEVLNLYRSKRIVLARTIDARYRADAAFKYAFDNNKATLKVGVTDIFYSYINKGKNEFQGLYGTYYNRNENRRFNVSLTYKFGGKATTPKKNQSNKEELDRIK